MISDEHFRGLILRRLAVLGEKLQRVGVAAGHSKCYLSESHAKVQEDATVREGVAQVSQIEAALLRMALGRLKDGTFGTCLVCNGPISRDRLEAVPYAPVCTLCSSSGYLH